MSASMSRAGESDFGDSDVRAFDELDELDATAASVVDVVAMPALSCDTVAVVAGAAAPSPGCNAASADFAPTSVAVAASSALCSSASRGIDRLLDVDVDDVESGDLLDTGVVASSATAGAVDDVFVVDCTTANADLAATSAAASSRPCCCCNKADFDAVDGIDLFSGESVVADDAGVVAGIASIDVADAVDAATDAATDDDDDDDDDVATVSERTANADLAAASE